MEGGKEQHFESIRPEERSYEREIREAYKDCPHLFVTHSSDLLNVALHTRTAAGSPSSYLVARSPFTKFDVLLEVRGSIISYPRLWRLVQEGRVEAARLPPLLYLNFEQQLLLSPKNIAKYLFTTPHPPPSPSPNCYIENHFGSKLLVTASRDIASGEELILERESLSRTLYSFSPSEF